MTYNIKAIPTAYAGVNFRSRLEARWAAFFDLCGWEWDYEPFDLDGWAPDFLLRGKVPALVEVKPVSFNAGQKTDKHKERLVTQARAAAGKAFRVGGSSERIVVGLGPFEVCSGEWALGVFAHQRMWDDADVALLYRGVRTTLDYASMEGSFQYRIGGQSDGDHHLKQLTDDTPEVMWRTAGNAVQWQVSEDRMPAAAAHSLVDVSRLIRRAVA